MNTQGPPTTKVSQDRIKKAFGDLKPADFKKKKKNFAVAAQSPTTSADDKDTQISDFKKMRFKAQAPATFI